MEQKPESLTKQKGKAITVDKVETFLGDVWESCKTQMSCQILKSRKNIQLRWKSF